MYADALVMPWYDAARELVPGVEPFDIHTHTGWNDPDGFSLTAERLIDALEQIDGQAAVFTLADPDGYRRANDRILAEAGASGGRLLPFCRVDPRADGRAEAERALAVGARGIKLHPRAERFRLADPEVEPVIALADERRLPVIVHAGRGIPALGRDAVDLARRYPDMRLILAHAGVCDLAWIWREAAGLPNLFFDTAWWNTSDLLALFAFVPPGQILYGSDAPYGTPLHSYTMAVRCACHAGLDADQIRAVMGAQARRLLAGEDPLDLGPAPGPERAASNDLLLERVYEFLISALNRAMVAGASAMVAGASAMVAGASDESIALARLACEVGNDAPQAPVCRSVLAVLDRHEQFEADPASLEPLDKGARFFPALHLLVLAALVARTPGVSVPQPEPEDVAERQTG